MSKKTNQKKKINIKLENNQSFIVEDLDILIHIQRTYASMMRGQLSEQDRVVCARVITATNSAIENVFISTTDGYSDEW
jgi:hypothetical protein